MANDRVDRAAASKFPFQSRLICGSMQNGYAQHVRELVGCKSPVRKRDSIRMQYAKCFLLSEVRGEGNCGRVNHRGKEACEYQCSRNDDTSALTKLRKCSR